MCCFHSLKPKGLHSLALMQPCVSFRCAATTTTLKQPLFLSDTHFLYLITSCKFWHYTGVFFVKNFACSANRLLRMLRAALSYSNQITQSFILIFLCSSAACVLRQEVTLLFKQVGLLYAGYGGATVLSGIGAQLDLILCRGICQGRTIGMTAVGNHHWTTNRCWLWSFKLCCVFVLNTALKIKQ